MLGFVSKNSFVYQAKGILLKVNKKILAQVDFSSGAPDLKWSQIHILINP